MGLADAMREAGIDEHYIAENYVGVADKLSGKNKEKEAVEKLLVDVLKEFTRLLDPPKTSSERAAERQAEKAATDSFVPVKLIHYVDRPERKGSATTQDDPATE